MPLLQTKEDYLGLTQQKTLLCTLRNL
jgi:hypothetical protein